MLSTRVAVVRGGPSSEYEISLSTGAGVLDALKKLGYYASDVVVTKKGEWLQDGKIKRPEQALMTTDVVFIAMHGAYGEDGTIQKICERLHIPFTGSNSFPSSIAFNKDNTKRALREHNIKTPKHLKLNRDLLNDLDGLVHVIKNSFGPEYVLKPTSSGSSHGIQMIDHFTGLGKAILDMFESEDEFMVEERIRGIRVSA